VPRSAFGPMPGSLCGIMAKAAFLAPVNTHERYDVVPNGPGRGRRAPAAPRVPRRR
jgi:hypothetical protein